MSKVIHRKKFQDGRETPQEMHSRLAFPVGAKCSGCGGPPLIKIRSFAEEDELLKRDPRLKILQLVNPENYASMRLKTKMGYYLRLGEVYACSRCGPEAERAAAKHPSWVFCDIDRGPNPLKIVIGG
ncbi:MAG: hypothetical protein E6Q97_04440 [Desulfurellales bacterium]|nr:MAG: hypothetical protein E6Q97_04440 [Desulfurellales bacterium]